MKLIDADALRKAFYDKCVEECACCKESSGPTVIVARVKCKSHDHCGLLDAAPTIDAIPVEWIEHFRQEAILNGDGLGRDMLDWLLGAWQKEQEAR